MKISSKSILSPGRAGMGRDAPSSLSTSLSRRLRNSGSIKGGASPAMFPTTAKKRGSFENPEPSSPKVTCIGQVRVKSKRKQAKKLRTLSRRHSTGEVSLRNLEHPLTGFASRNQNLHESSNLASSGTQNQNQEYSPPQRSWVHFPVTICDALRTFGSEFSCLFPCRKDEKTEGTQEGNRQGCAVFARWLVSVQDGDGDGQRDIELIVGEDEEEEEEEEEIVVKKSRRHVFEDLEIINDRIEGHKDEARVSICVPPKNALLLMRRRSDPMKLEALTHRSWEPTIAKNEEDDEKLVIEEDLTDLEMQQQQVVNLDQEQEVVQQDEAVQDQEQENVKQDEAIQDQEQETLQRDGPVQDLERDNVQHNEVVQDQEIENVEQDAASRDQEHGNVQQDEVGQDQEEESLYLESLFEENVNKIHEDDFCTEEAREEVSTMVMTEVAEISATHDEETVSNGVLERESAVKEERESERVLPDCLLMMMYEPKLSMEVSKETWVCSTDFIRRNSNRRKPPPPPPPPPAAVETDGEDDTRVRSTSNATAIVNNVMRVADGGRQTVLQQPARASCSLPGPPSMATVLGQKLADAMGYEPFVLTRCKSEPMKTAAAKLLPGSCVLENSKLEWLSRGTFGVGAAGLGF